MNNLKVDQERNVWIDILGSAGMVVSFIVILSPLPSVIEGLKKNNLKSLSSSYLTCAVVNSILWGIYGIKLNEFAMYMTNIFSSTVFMFYLCCLLIINDQAIRIIPYALGSSLMSYLIYLFIEKEIVGLIAFLISSIWMITSIEKMREALLERNSKFINLPVILSSMIGNFIWIIYGSMLRNFFIIFPNTLGLILYCFNIFIYLWVTNLIVEKNVLIKIIKLIFMVQEKPLIT